VFVGFAHLDATADGAGMAHEKEVEAGMVEWNEVESNALGFLRVFCRIAG